jgi:hypothetical protein
MVVRRTWAGLSWREQRQVLKAARARKRHPDPEIAEAARLWAEAVLAPRPRRKALGTFALWALLDFVLDSGGATGMLIAERRAAKRILEMERSLAARP